MGIVDNKIKFHRAGVVLASALTVVAVSAGAANATEWFVDGRNGGRYNAGTEASPYLFLWQALKVVRPGDTIYLVPSMTYGFQGFTATGESGAPITLAGSDPANPTKVTGEGVNSGVWINGNHLVVRNFDVTAPGVFPAVSLAPHRHHITVASNVIHDAGGNGINVVADDYVTISHNEIYGNAHITANAHNSGMSMLGSVDVDTHTGVKMIVDGNIVHDNRNVPNCTTADCLKTASDPDGSGIILDDNIRDRWDHIPYRGAFLITNNVVYHNGGRGIHIFKTDNVTVSSNTVWENNQDPYEAFWHPGEVSAVVAGNVLVANNILHSDGKDSPLHSGKAPNTHVSVSFEHCKDGRGPLIARDNLGYNPQKDRNWFFYGSDNTNPVIVGPNKFGGPKLVNPARGDFRFRLGSPAHEAGNLGLSPRVDIFGVSRLPVPSIGAFQDAAPL